jgi:hypothetical protein
VTASIGVYLLYNTALERKILLSQQIIELEATDPPSATSSKKLADKRNLLEVTQKNEQVFAWFCGLVFVAGVAAVSFGGRSWYKVRLIEDQLNALRLKKTKLEVAKLRTGATPANQTQEALDGHSDA